MNFPHYFDKGRCVGHHQWNGRHCKHASGPDQWCINCAGHMLQSERDNLRAFVEELAEEGCTYKDNCPPFGTNHGACLSCQARRTLDWQRVEARWKELHGHAHRSS
jgi:hypothetical protein